MDAVLFALRLSPPVPEDLVSLTVRTLDAADASVLDRVATGVFDHPVDAKATRAFLSDPRHHISVALDEGVVVGFASAVHYVHPDKPRPEMWINEVGVAPTHRGRGVGRAVLGNLMRHARSLGCTEAWVLTDRANPAALGLYAALGARENDEDTVLFTFDLRDSETARARHRD